jgi:hypothetical protein
MRPVTAEEAEHWTALAEEHSCTNEDGDIALARGLARGAAPDGARASQGSAAEKTDTETQDDQ